MATLADLIRGLPDAEYRAVRAGGEAIQRATLSVVHRKTGRLAVGIARGLKVRKVGDNYQATIDSGVSYDQYVDARFGHYAEGESIAAEQVKAAVERELDKYFKGV